MNKNKDKILIQQQEEQIQELEVDNSNLQNENLRWQEKYGKLHTDYVQLEKSRQPAK